MNENLLSRADHLAWCKQRALRYCEVGSVTEAWASFSSDMGKHPDTAAHPALKLGLMRLLQGITASPQEMRSFFTGLTRGLL